VHLIWGKIGSRYLVSARLSLWVR